MNAHTLLKVSSLSLLISALVACGGGGGGGSSSITPASVGATNLNVTAATGDPIVGATITVIDGAGVSEVCAGVTDASGKLACQLKNAKAFPFFIQAAKQSSLTYGVLPAASDSVNITPVSDLMARKVANDIQVIPSQIVSSPTLMTTVTTVKTQTAVDVVTSVVKAVATATTGSLTADPLTGTYSAVSPTDKLDVLIKNLPMNADSGAVNISVPNKNGAVVTVSVDLATTSAGAAKDVANAILSNGNVTTANTALDADPILVFADQLIDKLGKCKADPSLRPQMVNMIDPGVTYNNGFTKAGWVDDICTNSIAGVTRFGVTKSLGRLGDTVIYFMGIKQPSTGIYAETIFGFKKVAGEWKLASNDLPINMGDSIRHALSLNFDSKTGSAYNNPRFAYQRYVDAWVGNKYAQNKTTGLATGATAPDKIQVFVMSLTDAQTKAAQGTGFPTAPNYTLYRVAQPGSTCGQTNYTLLANRTGCSSFVQDKSSTYQTWDYVDSTDLFSKVLEKNEYNVFVYKLLDVNGRCMNCETVGDSQVPRAISVLGRAWKYEEIFGSNAVAESSLRAGTVIATNANLGSARSIYAAPSQAAATEIINKLYTNNPGKTIVLPWSKPTNYENIDINLWGSSYACNQAPNVNKSVDYSVDTFDIVGNSYAFTYGQSPQDGNVSPEYGKSFGNAQYVNFALSTNIQRSEFVFYIQGSRDSNICTN